MNSLTKSQKKLLKEVSGGHIIYKFMQRFRISFQEAVTLFAKEHSLAKRGFIGKEIKSF
jgi:hypothetical protein